MEASGTNVFPSELKLFGPPVEYERPVKELILTTI